MISTLAAKVGITTALRFVASLGSGLFKHAKADSLVSFTKATRVEPITLIDQRALALPYLQDAMQAMSSIFAGYYLQAVSLLVNVGNINVVRLLDSLSPDRDAAGAANAYLVDKVNQDRPSLLSLESYRYALPIPGKPLTVSLEDNASKNEYLRRQIRDGAKHVEGAMREHGVKVDIRDDIVNRDGGDMKHLAKKADAAIDGRSGSVGIDALKEATNLSVGKMLEVTISGGEKQKATFPISVRLIATLMSPSILTHILGDGSRDVTARERFHGWRSGQLEFIRDIILCQDLIDERRKALIKDDTGAYAEILARRASNTAAGVMSATPSIGTASNLVVITAQTARELEASIGGRLSDKHTRDKVFKNTYIMIMMVIDPEWEQVTIYHRGIALPTKLSVKDLKVANKGSGPDVGEILKAYQLGNNPTL